MIVGFILGLVAGIVCSITAFVIYKDTGG